MLCHEIENFALPGHDLRNRKGSKPSSQEDTYMTRTINRPINVTGYYFAKGRTFPSRVQYGNRELYFEPTGLRCLVKKGQEMFEIFNMSDGRDQYRLKFEPTARNWTLLTHRAMT
jgi:hypothetical protein